jgi:histone-binding protein RBBP4
MDQLFKQLGGAGGAGGSNPFGNLQGLFNAGNIGGGDSQEEDEEILDEEAQMENVRVYYDIFLQNTLKSTSHSVQWLPISESDPEYS